MKRGVAYRCNICGIIRLTHYTIAKHAAVWHIAQLAREVELTPEIAHEAADDDTEEAESRSLRRRALFYEDDDEAAENDKAF